MRDLLDVIRNIERDIQRRCRKKEIGILATGGLDSSLLAYLTKNLRPTLYFAAVMDRKTRRYNKDSITRLRVLSKLLGLPLVVIPVLKHDYVVSSIKVKKNLKLPLDDRSLPAVFAFFQKIADRKKTNILISGMGVNEIFDLPLHALRKRVAKKMPRSIRLHQKIARYYGLDFYAPFMGGRLAAYAFRTPLKERKNKKSLKKLLRKEKILPSYFIPAHSKHTIIPGNFRQAAFSLLRKAAKYGRKA